MPLLVLPATLLVLMLLVMPMAGLFRISLNQYSPTELMVSALTGQNYLNAIADPFYQKILLITVGVALGCTLLCLALAIAPAYWLARMESRWKSAFMILTLFPLLVGNVVRAAGWMALLNTDGVINAFFGLFGLGPFQLLYTPLAVILGTAAVVLPYMILTLASVIESVPRQTEEAAANLGARPLTVLRRVLLPQAAPGVLAGSVLVFIMAMNAYATPVLLGGPSFRMLAPAVYDQFVRVGNWPFGAALAFVLLFSTLALSFFVSFALARSLRAKTN
ncbi:spermidine/putrescine transport system permease protein (plasmid) [Ketogulonicigenium robustum]|uniref:Spermidine/putrescine transport system permease protein n=1 Tax=Ketogulonicigenium robustum TaxID=92947 RepID=A0A1W6P3B0_9RHOB|nr:ABC transporter permease [Ketogulonicigenium robustum]ARO15827.1 spermidine/putrescine transport system permease protein [Ketogulonicigenium robustum]